MERAPGSPVSLLFERTYLIAWRGIPHSAILYIQYYMYPGGGAATRNAIPHAHRDNTVWTCTWPKLCSVHKNKRGKIYNSMFFTVLVVCGLVRARLRQRCV